MKLNTISENRWIHITGGANSHEPGYIFPWSHPHEITNPGIWLHGTSDIYIDSIRQNGLNNLLAPKENRTAKHTTKMIHLTKNTKLARTIAINQSQRHGGKPIIITIDGTKIPEDIIGSSLDSQTNTVPPESIINIKYI